MARRLDLRWVDDIYIAVVCVQITTAKHDLRLRCRLSLEQFADKIFRAWCGTYIDSGLDLKEECPDILAGFIVEWYDSLFAVSSVVPDLF